MAYSRSANLRRKVVILVATMFTAIVGVLLEVKQMMLFISAMLLGNVTVLINASAGLMIDIHTLLEKVIALLIG